MELFLKGLTVKDPLDGGREVTFGSAAEGKKFLLKLRESNEGFPLNEAGRDGAIYSHIKLFLYSRGYSPEDVVDLMMNPDSERSRAIEEEIEGFRKEFVDQIVNKDTDRISRMYVDAFRNLKDRKLDWVCKLNTTESFIRNLPYLSAVTGVQSFWVQTNNLGGTMRPVDRELMLKIRKGMDAEGIDYNRIVDTLQTLEAAGDYASTKMEGLTEDYGKDYVDDLPLNLNYFGRIPEETTFLEFGSSDEPKYNQILNMHSATVGAGFMYGEEYRQNVFDWVRGEEGTIAPVLFLDSINYSNYAKMPRCGILPLRGEKLHPNDVRDKDWKGAMENYFRNEALMDPGSVIHCFKLAEQGGLDAVSGVQGDSGRLLQVMNGKTEEYDKLSDLAKAAATGNLVMAHPELFTGSVQQMLEAARRLGKNLDDPVYASALERSSCFVMPKTQEKYEQVKETLAREKLETWRKDAPPEAKKRLARTLFLMQLGDAERESSANGKNREAEMLTVLAAGGRVSFHLQKTGGKKGKTPRLIPEKYANTNTDVEVGQSTLYDDHGNMFVRLFGAKGYANASYDWMDVDLRTLSPDHLSAVLEALNRKLDSMSGEELDQMIGELGGASLPRSEMAERVRGLTDNAVIRLAAREIDPKLELGLNDFIRVERAYSMELKGERKYKEPDPVPTEEFEKALREDTVPERREYFRQYLEYHKEQIRQMKMYADAAERMHRIREANENSDEPLGNVRIFAWKKEKELAEKYRAAKEAVRKTTSNIDLYKIDNSGADNKEGVLSKAWVNAYLNNSDLSAEVVKNAGKKDVTQKELEASLVSDFSAVDFEASTFREQQNLEGNKWTLLGVKYSNSDKYQDILDSMERLKEMRGLKATEENIRSYQKEYEFLRDLCEDYIVTRKNPWSSDGKERKRMVIDVWEGMSNVNAASFQAALASADPEKKLSDINIHAGDRRTISLQELQAKEAEIKARVTAEKARRKEAAKRAAQQKEGKTRQTEHGKSLQDRINLS